MRSSAFVVVLPLALLVGCGEDLPGFYWELEQAGVDDGDMCNATAVPPADELLEYRLEIDVQDLVISVGPDQFATGVVQGCTISYQTVVWPEERNDYEIAWQMTGSAVISRGGTDGCGPENGTDWDGTETFTIITSEDPALAPGCTYTVGLSGAYVKEVK